MVIGFSYVHKRIIKNSQQYTYGSGNIIALGHVKVDRLTIFTPER